MSRLENYRSKYSDVRPSSRPSAAVMADFKPRPAPPPVFLTRRFWHGILWIGTLNLLVFYSLRNLDMSWLFPPMHLSGTGPKKLSFPWPKGLVPLTIEQTADGETIVTVPTRQLTPEEDALLRKIWESQSKAPLKIQTLPSQAQTPAVTGQK